MKRRRSGSLCITRAHARRLQRWASAADPEEACGLLVGTRGPRWARVFHVSRLHNVATGRTTGFELDAGAVVAAENRARALGLELVGSWHSHPRASALPSAADRRGAVPGWCMLIVPVHREGPARAWRLAAGELAEEEIELRSFPKDRRVLITADVF